MKHAPTLSLVLLSLLSIEAHAGDWPYFRGSDRDGTTAEAVSPEALAGGVTPVWKGKVGTGFSAITVGGGRLYTMGNTNATDIVWCLDANTGAENWKYSYPEELTPNLYEGGPNAAVTINDAQVFTVSKTGKAFCFDAGKGTVLWKADLAVLTGAGKPEWGYSGAPLVLGDVVIYNVGSAGTALNRKTGALVWKSGTAKAGYSSPLPFKQGAEWLVLLMTGKSASAIRPATGQVAWSHPWETSYDINAADPIVQGNEVFVSSGYNHGASVIKIDGQQTSVVWENKNLRNQFSSSVLWKGFLYGVDENQLRCVDAKTGEVKWTDKATGKGTLLIAAGRIVALSEKGELIIAEATPDGFKPLSRAQILGGKCWTMPTLANGKVYARNAKGDLVCVNVAAK
jgi:outer membrane protein assembly factor BamB